MQHGHPWRVLPPADLELQKVPRAPGKLPPQYPALLERM
jgi:hypothetical protein